MRGVNYYTTSIFILLTKSWKRPQKKTVIVEKVILQMNMADLYTIIIEQHTISAACRDYRN